MGMSSLLDPNAAKEFLRRATALGMNTAAMAAAAASSGGGGSGSTPPSLKSGLKMDGGGGGGGGPSDPGSPHANDPSGLRRPRSVYNSSQVAQLEAYFRFNECIDGERKRRLSSITNIPEHQIKVWFQNRRQKKKREEAEMMQGGSGGGAGGSGGAGPGMSSMNFKEEPGAIGAHMIQTMDEDEDDYGAPGGGGGLTHSGGGAGAGPNHDDPGDEEEPITGDPIAASYQA